jgi:hypothetical protein
MPKNYIKPTYFLMDNLQVEIYIVNINNRQLNKKIFIHISDHYLIIQEYV